jgi:hypothetical protein
MCVNTVYEKCCVRNVVAQSLFIAFKLGLILSGMCERGVIAAYCLSAQCLFRSRRRAAQQIQERKRGWVGGFPQGIAIAAFLPHPPQGQQME